MRRVLSPIIAAALVATPITAQAAERTASSFEKGEKLAGNPWIPWVVALAVAVAIIIVVADNDDEPVSP